MVVAKRRPSFYSAGYAINNLGQVVSTRSCGRTTPLLTNARSTRRALSFSSASQSGRDVN